MRDRTQAGRSQPTCRAECRVGFGHVRLTPGIRSGPIGRNELVEHRHRHEAVAHRWFPLVGTRSVMVGRCTSDRNGAIAVSTGVGELCCGVAADRQQDSCGRPGSVVGLLYALQSFPDVGDMVPVRADWTSKRRNEVGGIADISLSLLCCLDERFQGFSGRRPPVIV